MKGENHAWHSVFAEPRRWVMPLLSVLLALLLASSAASQRNARVLHRNLAELVSDAHAILVGRVVSVRGEPHPQYASVRTVVVSLQVSEVLKGQAGPQFTFRLFVSDYQDIQTDLDYRVGEEVLLMMTRPHPVTGFSSPAGLEQGRFRVERDAQGKRVVVNGMDNLGLFRKLEQQAPKLRSQISESARQVVAQHQSGPIAYDHLKSMIQALVGQP